MKRQKGFWLVGLGISLAFLSILALVLVRESAAKSIKDNAKSYYNRVLYIERQITAYVTDKYQTGTNINSAFIFPSALSDLEGNYIPACTVVDNEAGRCMRYNQTPWGDIETSDYNVTLVTSPDGLTYYRAEIAFPLPDKDFVALSTERSITLSLFSRLSNIRYDDANNKVVLLIDRPDKAFAYDSLVKRSGDDSTLLGDWDTGGNFAVTNAYDFSIKGEDINGKTRQISVARGLTRRAYVKHGEQVNKPVCPSYLTATIWLSIARTKIPSAYTATGSIVPEFIDRGTYWDIKAQQRVKHNSSGRTSINYDATVLSITSCE